MTLARKKQQTKFSASSPASICPSRRLHYVVHNQLHEMDIMRSTTFTVRVDTGVKKRLERLAKSTGRSRSFLAAEAISGYLEVNEWQVAGINRAIASLDRGEGVSHDLVKDWVGSWGSANEKPAPRRS
jgi:predicted transcriptional regulator